MSDIDDEGGSPRAERDLARRLHAIYDLDLTRLEDMVHLGRHTRAVVTTLALVVSAAERDARIKLGTVRMPGVMGPAQARTRAWLVTRALRTATAALRQASAQTVAYRAELDKQFVVPAREAARNKSVRARRRDARDGGFNILGGS